MLFQATVARARINHGAGYEPNPLLLGPACSGPEKPCAPHGSGASFLSNAAWGEGLAPNGPKER